MEHSTLIQAGLDILRREACGSQDRSWKRHNEIMRRAEDHVRACGADWFEIEPEFSQEIAELLGL